MSLTQISEFDREGDSPLPIPRDLEKEFSLTPNGVYDIHGKYYVSNGLWNHWLVEGRRFKFKHNFQFIQHLIEDGIPPEGSRNLVMCSHCGEDRKVWIGVSMYELNRDGFCTPPEGYVIDNQYNVVKNNIWTRIKNALLG